MKMDPELLFKWDSIERDLDERPIEDIQGWTAKVLFIGPFGSMAPDEYEDEWWGQLERSAERRGLVTIRGEDPTRIYISKEIDCDG